MRDEPRPPPWTEASGSAPGRPAEGIRTADGVLVLSDFDGTLADIQPRPDQAHIRPESRAALASLADVPQTAVAVVSGRALADVRERVGLDGIGYAGNHGLEISVPGRRFVHPDAEGAASVIETVCEELRDRLAAVEGAVVEEKGLTATVHYRRVPSGAVDRIREAVRESMEGRAGTLRTEDGKQVIELRPAVDWDKGRAVEWLREVLVPDGESWHPVYVGDDVTDEDAFRAFSGVGTTVRVGDEGVSTDADYLVASPKEVAMLLTWLADVRGRDGGPSR